MRIKLQSKISNVNQKDKAKRKQNTKENNSQRHLFDTEKMCNAVFTLTINLDKHTYTYIYIIHIANIAKKLNMKRYLRNATSVFQFCKFKKQELYYICIVFLYTIKNNASAEGNIYIYSYTELFDFNN